MKKITMFYVILVSLSIIHGKIKEDIPVNIAVHTFEPMVMWDENERLTGFDLDILYAVSDIIGINPVISFGGTVGDLIKKVETEETDAACSGITITEDRESRVDFSHSYFSSGLKILIRKENIKSIIDQLVSYASVLPKLLPIFLIMLIYCFVGSFLIWIFEKGNEMFSDKPMGIFDGFYWINVVLTTVGFGDKVPLSKFGRILAIILMWTGIFCIVPMVTGTIASELTAGKIKNYIASKDDLKGRSVAVKRNTVASDRLKSRGLKLVYVDSIPEAVGLLKSGKVDAVIHDVPAILYAEKNNDGVISVGDIFDNQDYGFAFPEGSPMREKFNRALLALKENGTYDRIYRKYFLSQ